MGPPGGAPATLKLVLGVVAASGCSAQRSGTTSVCMDQASADAMRSACTPEPCTPDSMEYQMLMMRYQNGIADSMGLSASDVVVHVPPACAPAPPTPPAITRPGVPAPPAPPPPSPPATVTGNADLEVSPEYAAAVCRAGSDEQRVMISAFQEQTAAQLSTCTSRTQSFKSGRWQASCEGCGPGTCLQADAIRIDPSTFGCPPPQGQTVAHEMTVTVSDAWAATLCAGPGSPGYDGTVRLLKRSVADNLGIQPQDVAVEELTSSLDCGNANHEDGETLANSVHIDITDDYAHQLCDPNSQQFAAFKQAFREQIAASINGACTPSTQRGCPTQGMASGMTMPPPPSAANGPSPEEVENAAAGGGSSGFDLAVIVLVVACVGMGYRHKTRPPQAKYQAVNADEEIPLGDYSIDGPSDGGVDRDRRENPSFAGQFGSARIGSGKRR